MSVAREHIAADRCAVAASVPLDWPGASNSRIAVAAGVQWHVQIQGTGPVAVLLHGAGASSHSMLPLSQELNGAYCCIGIDLPGHGFTSSYPQGDYTLRRTARALDALFDALEITPALIIGHSAGAAIALRWLLDQDAAAAAPQPLLVAINPALEPFGGAARFAFPALARLAAGSASLASFMARQARGRRQVERLIESTGSQIPEPMLDCYQALFQRDAHVRAVLSMMAGWQLEGLVDAVCARDPELHVVVGDRDRAVSPGRTLSVLRRLSRATLSRLPDYGHLVHETAPAQVARAVRDAIDQRAQL